MKDFCRELRIDRVFVRSDVDLWLAIPTGLTDKVLSDEQVLLNPEGRLTTIAHPEKGLVRGRLEIDSEGVVI